MVGEVLQIKEIVSSAPEVFQWSYHRLEMRVGHRRGMIKQKNNSWSIHS